MEWKTSKISDLYEIGSGISITPDKYGRGYPFLTFKDIFNSPYIKNTIDTLVDSSEKDRKNSSVLCGDVFLTRTSETEDELGMSTVALKDYPNATFNGFSKRLRPITDEIEPLYAVYYFRSPYFRAAVSSMSSIITRASLNNTNINHLNIVYPQKNIQVKIGKILFAYDSLIENNTKRIRLLEQMAENLYKEWFVRFRFPGHEKVEMENGLPKGWKIERLGDFANVIMGQSPESCFYNEEKKGMPFHQGCGSFGDLYLINDIYSTEGKRIAEPNSIIFSVRAPVGRINITIDKIILGRGVASINAKNGNNAFLLWLLKNKFSKTDMIGNGSVFSSVTKDELLKQKLVIPSEDIETKFNHITSGFEKQMLYLTKQNQSLIKQRDLLLPRLMSGKLEVNP